MRTSLLLIIFNLSFFSGFTQILNDSTVNIYGPNTTKYFLEEDVYNSIDTLYYLDTAIAGFQRFTFPQKHNFLYQDLGNKGTAIQPLFYQSPASIGFRSGFSSYDLYYHSLLRVRFYDTKSPYSKFNYVQGGRGVSFLETEISRNITSDWNLGISFNRLSANPQIAAESRPLNPEVDHYSYSIYTAFKSKNKKYFIDAYFRRMHHQVHEPGGVQITDNYLKQNGEIDLEALFTTYNGHSKELENALSGDRRFNIHLYHQYTFSPIIGVYHLFDYENQRVRYEDISGTNYNHAFYGTNLLDKNSTPQETTFFRVLRNDVGIKGAIRQFKYRFYLKRRNIFVDNFRLFDVDWRSEDYAGGEFAVRFSERALLHLNSELLANTTFRGQRSDYKINFSFVNRYIKANFTTGLYSPTYLQRIYFSNNHSWDNTDSLSGFDPTFSHDLNLSTSVDLGFLKITPHAKVSLVNNYIYFVRKNSMVQPEQAVDQLFVTSPGVDLNLRAGHFNIRNNFTYNLVQKGENFFRVPQMINNSSIYYEELISRKAHVLQVGFDVSWLSEYRADYYMPSIQQFYIQSDYTFKVKPNITLDFFAAMKINRTRVFAKVSNLAQGVFNPSGYMVRPFYYGFQRTIDVGVNWMFFN